MSTVVESTPETSSDEPAEHIRWRPVTRVAFRWCFLYFGLFCLMDGWMAMLLAGPVFPDAYQWPARFITPIIDWTGPHILGLHADRPGIVESGSDNVYGWSSLFCWAVAATFGTLVWSLADRRRPHYRRLYAWFRAFVRIYLAGEMLLFAVQKMDMAQMPFQFRRLVEPFGDFSPQGVLYAQISVSHPYEVLLGCAELLAGLLLLVPRTSTLGAMLCTVDMAQVFLDNMTYDIRLKTTSFHFLLLSLLLLAPMARRLSVAMLSDKAFGPMHPAGLFASRRANRIAVAVQLLIGVWMLATIGYYAKGTLDRPEPPLRGVWSVDTFTSDGITLPPLQTDPLRWQNFIVDAPFHTHDPCVLTVQHMNGAFEEFGAKTTPADHDITVRHTIDLGTFTEHPLRQTWTYTQSAPGRLTLTAPWHGHTVTVHLHRRPLNSFPLETRGFHWTQQTPYNR